MSTVRTRPSVLDEIRKAFAVCPGVVVELFSERSANMHLVDTIVCVRCGQREYVLAKGKSARVQNGVCVSCLPKSEVKEYAGSSSTPASDGEASQPKGVSARRSSS